MKIRKRNRQALKLLEQWEADILFDHIRKKLWKMIKDFAGTQTNLNGSGYIHLPLQWIVKHKNTLLTLIRKIDKRK